MRSLNFFEKGPYGFGVDMKDDSYNWFFRNEKAKLNQRMKYLLLKGHQDNSTRANVSITFKFDKTFFKHLGISSQAGMHLITAKVYMVFK